jgi:hypothetical protein
LTQIEQEEKKFLDRQLFQEVHKVKLDTQLIIEQFYLHDINPATRVTLQQEIHQEFDVFAVHKEDSSFSFLYDCLEWMHMLWIVVALARLIVMFGAEGQLEILLRFGFLSGFFGILLTLFRWTKTGE